MLRRLATLAATTIVLSGCWADGWLAANVVHREYDNRNPPAGPPRSVTQRAAFAYPAAREVWLDHNCAVDRVCVQNTSDPAFVLEHERGHIVDYRHLGNVMGGDAVGVERSAQCIAEVILGRPRHGGAGAGGAYWDCPADWVEHFRRLMKSKAIIK